MNFARVRQFYLGHYPRTLFKKVLLPLIFVIYFSFLILSGILYPEEYAITSHTISDLGNPQLNPFPGWFFFSLSFWILGLSFIPLFMHLHWSIVVLHKIEAKTGTSFNFIAAIGMILLGFFPNLPETDLMHIIAAVLAFGGLTAAIIFYWSAVIHDSLQKALKYHHLAIVMILSLITLLLAAILFLGVVQISATYFLSEEVWFLDFPFWEWMLFIVISIQLLFVGFIIPDQFRNS